MSTTTEQDPRPFTKREWAEVIEAGLGGAWNACHLPKTSTRAEDARALTALSAFLSQGEHVPTLLSEKQEIAEAAHRIALRLARAVVEGDR